MKDFQPDRYYSAMEIARKNYLPHARNTATVVKWLQKFKAKYPEKVVVRNFGMLNRDGKDIPNRRYSIRGDNLVQLLANIEDGSL